jgi:hypothetical protein
MFFITNSRTGEIYWSKERSAAIISLMGPHLQLLEVPLKLREMLTLHITRMADKKERLILKRRDLQPQKRKFQFSSNGKRLYLIEQEPETKLSVYELDLFNRN